MIQAETISQVREWVRAQRREGRTVGLVPTMGYLHEGHLSLVREAKSRGHTVIMSIFVNPLQFGPHEDYDRYPRDLARDRALAEQAGVDCLFAPSVDEMYPTPPQVRVVVGTLAERLCGASRPGHFDGVVTVVSKLFHIVLPDEAFFGEKDFQQLRIVDRMAKDLNFPVKVVGCPTVREDDGLAMSSRNQYLNPEERKVAAALPRALLAAQRRCEEGVVDAHILKEAVRRDLTGAGHVIDYVEVVREDDLEPAEVVEGACRLMAAVYIGQTRLIDNVPLRPGGKR
ncbi:MAG: pantoate--beta-alanine ligase [Alicyclobacillaceae bacterium]|nr:pantoate--beta-alanine ligase [Alicyclobacillaceae bacterium]